MLKQTSLTSALIVFSSLLPSISQASGTAPVSGFARSFILGTALSNATITVLETGQQFKTDSNGKYGPIQYPIGKPITLIFEKWNYKTTQSDTSVVPSEGLTSPYNNITFQIASIESYYVLAGIVGAKIEDNACHVVTTITAYHKTMDDIPQGEEHAKAVLIPNVAMTPFYFDIFHLCRRIVL